METVQLWATTVAAVCGAFLAVGALIAALYINLPRGQTAFGNWIKRNLTGDLIDAVTGLRADLTRHAGQLQEVADTQRINHAEGQANFQRIDETANRLTDALQHTNDRIRIYTEEHMGEANARDNAILSLTQRLADFGSTLSDVADRLLHHERSRSKHAPPRKRETP